MLARKFVVVAIASLCLAAQSADAQNLSGMWNIRRANLYGTQVPAAVLQRMKLNLTASTFSATSQSLSSTGSYSITPGQIKQISFKIENGADTGRELRGIYQFVGSDLQIAYSESDYPTGFEATPQNRYLVVTYTQGSVAAAGPGNRGANAIPQPGQQGGNGAGGATGLSGVDD